MKPRVSPIARARSTEVIGNPGHAHRDPLLLRRGLVEPDARELGIDERAVGDQPVAGAARLSRRGCRAPPGSRRTPRA